MLKPHNPNGTYSPYSFGTNQPDLIGSNGSHGCIRLRNAPIRRLAKILPLGTPVYVRA